MVKVYKTIFVVFSVILSKLGTSVSVMKSSFHHVLSTTYYVGGQERVTYKGTCDLHVEIIINKGNNVIKSIT